MREDHPADLTPWTVLSSSWALDHPWARVRRDVCMVRDGMPPIEYFTYVGPDFAIVFAVTTRGDILVTRQYKHGIRAVVLELPAGIIDADDASPETAAHRELREETGYAGGEWLSLGVLCASPSKSTVRAHAFLARGVARVADPAPDDSEAIAVLTATPAELLAALQRGDIADATSVAVCYAGLSVLG